MGDNMAQQEEINKTKEPQAAQLLQQPVLARLGTAHPKTAQPHVVPVWFGWEEDTLYINAFSSTRKVKDLLRNPRCSVLIEPKDPSQSKIQGILLEGICEVISEQPYVACKAEWIYTRYLGVEGVKAPDPQSWMTDPESRIIKLTPLKVYIW
jgi:general stress protein 26